MDSLKPSLYALALLSCLTCTLLLFRRYARARVPLLLWSALCFAMLTINNLLLFIDLVLLPDVDLRIYRYLASLAGMAFLLYGFIWEADR